jgi:DNA relaxase NicK
MNDQKTTVDYLTFRAQAEPPEVLEALRPLFGTLGSSLTMKTAGRGHLGFQQAAEISVGDMPLVRMDYGGESQRGWVRSSMSGKACEWVQDWTALDELEAIKAEPRRLDLALTTWNGEVSHDTVVEAHGQGRFVSNGRPPALQQITSSDPAAGRTCYVGTREKSDKFFRTYEKGYQLLQASGLSRLAANVTHIEGFPIAGIYRCELELKAVTRPIDWDVIDRRDQYFAGAYPFCSDVLPEVEADILMRRKERAPQLDLQAALENCRIQFGSILYTALTAYHGDIGAVFQKVVGKSHNEDLLRAGVLLVDHE